MIKHKEKNKYSLNAESYGISKVQWREIKETVTTFEIDSIEAVKRFKLDETIIKGEIVIDEDLCSKRVWFLYDVLLQEKYNHLYKREKLVNPKVGDFVYCDYEGFGRGIIKNIFADNSMFFVKFDNRDLLIPCCYNTTTTQLDNVARKITRL